MNTPPDWLATEAELESFQPLFFEHMAQMRDYASSALSPVKNDLPALIRKYFAEENAFREETAAAVRCVLTKRALPHSISSGALYFLWQRWSCASDFLGSVFPPQSIESPLAHASGWPAEKTCAWLLDDLWVRRFDLWLKLSALQLHGPFPFYGLEASVGAE